MSCILNIYTQRALFNIKKTLKYNLFNVGQLMSPHVISRITVPLNYVRHCWKYKFLSVYSPFFLLILRIRVKNLNVYGEYAEVFNRIRRILKCFNVHEVRVVSGTQNRLRVFKLIRRIRKIYGKKAKKSCHTLLIL